MATAYVFIGTMPDLHHARTALMATAPVPLPCQGMAIYCLALAIAFQFLAMDYVLREAHSKSYDTHRGLGSCRCGSWLKRYHYSSG